MFCSVPLWVLLAVFLDFRVKKMNEIEQRIFKKLSFLDEDLKQAWQVSFNYYEKVKILELYSALLSYQYFLQIKGKNNENI